MLALLVLGERDHEAAQQEGSFRIGQRALVVPEAVGIFVLGELLEVGAQRGGGTRVLGRQRATQRRQQERRVKARVPRRALPSP